MEITRAQRYRPGMKVPAINVPKSHGPTLVGLQLMLSLFPKRRFSFLKPTLKNVISGTLDSNHCATGWIRKIRKQKRFWFVELNDGSCFESLQIVVPSGLIEEKDKLSLGSSLEISGKLVKRIGGMQKIEMLADKVRLLGDCPGESYPIQKLENSAEFMRTKALNFRLRTEKNSSVARLKSEAAHSLLNNLHKDDFIRVFPPILTEHDCEGGGEVFRVEANQKDFFSNPAYLTVSTQLHLEIAAASLPRVYSLSPVFRAENQHTSKHLSEFWMLECEISFLNDLESLLGFIESLIKSTVKDIATSRHDGLDCSILEDIVKKPFAKISYTEAIKELSSFNKSFNYPLEWGNDLQTEHERFIAETIFKGPVFVTHYPSNLKPFYMKLSGDNNTALCTDLLVPGIGEIVGGSLREDDYGVLKEKMKQRLGFNGDNNPLQWYLDLRKFGTVPHGGFGLGFDRLLQYISGTNNIRDTVMIPRYNGSIKF